MAKRACRLYSSRQTHMHPWVYGLANQNRSKSAIENKHYTQCTNKKLNVKQLAISNFAIHVDFELDLNAIELQNLCLRKYCWYQKAHIEKNWQNEPIDSTHQDKPICTLEYMVWPIRTGRNLPLKKWLYRPFWSKNWSIKTKSRLYLVLNSEWGSKLAL